MQNGLVGHNQSVFQLESSQLDHYWGRYEWLQPKWVPNGYLGRKGFKKIKDILPNVECNQTLAKEHVSEAKRMIKTIKERTRGLIATLCRMKIEFVYFLVFWLNVFLVKSGILSVFLPRELLVWWLLDYAKHCRVIPGTYCVELMTNPHFPTPTMLANTHETVAMGPTGIYKDVYSFVASTHDRSWNDNPLHPIQCPLGLSRK
jgi:hypothetical protein